MQTELKKMSKKQLLHEYEAYDEIIHKICCYSVKDVMWLDQIEREMDKRGLL